MCCTATGLAEKLLLPLVEKLRMNNAASAVRRQIRSESEGGVESADDIERCRARIDCGESRVDNGAAKLSTRVYARGGVTDNRSVRGPQ